MIPKWSRSKIRSGSSILFEGDVFFGGDKKNRGEFSETMGMCWFSSLQMVGLKVFRNFRKPMAMRTAVARWNLTSHPVLMEEILPNTKLRPFQDHPFFFRKWYVLSMTGWCSDFACPWIGEKISPSTKLIITPQNLQKPTNWEHCFHHIFQREWVVLASENLPSGFLTSWPATP